MMQFANKDLAKVNGLTFYRLMGSGKGEVLTFPRLVCLLLTQVWESEEAEVFFTSSDKTIR
jgi:hypothetical protein